jgi:endonuclease/exonuclease/phosphatase family metal-dependent hydrolase
MSELRVMTWNLRGAARPDLDDVAGRILAARPDVIGIQEIRRGQAAWLASRLRWHHHWALKHLAYGPFMWWAEGMAVLSPHPLPFHARTVLNPAAFPWSYRRRIMQRILLDAPFGPLTIVNAHLASHQAPLERQQQSVVVADEVRRQQEADPSTIAVVIGDLNAADEPLTLAPLQGVGLRDAWHLSEDGPSRASPGFTNPASRPNQRLDYVFVPDALSVDGVDVPSGGDAWSRLSDHLPVTARLRVR